ncbi:hypothetical protein T492DRAFT_878913 [Pavlovales sp. CCMP2436]|nr:hypothetical protein T492DRAFT_878913 [Pavlovales sp. CCMP2436]
MGITGLPAVAPDAMVHLALVALFVVIAGSNDFMPATGTSLVAMHIIMHELGEVDAFVVATRLGFDDVLKATAARAILIFTVTLVIKEGTRLTTSVPLHFLLFRF